MRNHPPVRRPNPRAFLRPAVEALEGRTLLSADFTLVPAALRDTLTALQTRGMPFVLSQKVPLAGTQLQELAARPEARFLERVRDALDAQFTAAPDPIDTADDVTDAFLAAFGLRPGDVTVDQTNPDDVTFQVRLRDGPVTFDDSSITMDVGLASLDVLGLTPTDGPRAVRVQLDHDLTLRFGVTNEAFYLDTTAGPELSIGVKASIPDLRNASATLGLLPVKLSDGASPSEFNGTLTFDVSDADGRLTLPELPTFAFTEGTTGLADINLTALGDVGAEAFPTISSDFHLHWDLAVDAPPTVEFRNVTVDAGSFFRLLEPVVEKVKEGLAPIKPVLDILSFRLPVLSDLAGKDVTLLDLVAKIGGSVSPEYQQFVTGFNHLRALQSLPTGILPIQLGHFDLGATDVRSGFNWSDVKPRRIGSAPPSLVEQLSRQGVAGKTALDFLNNLGSVMVEARLPLFEDGPNSVFKLLLGQSADLVSYRLPSFHLRMEYNQSLPVIPPILWARFHGDVGLTAGLAFGYDTHGLETGDLLDGFYLTNDSGLTFDGSITASLHVPLIDVEGGLYASVSFTAHDDSPKDGRAHLDELGHCLFDTHGALTAALNASIGIGTTVFGKFVGYRKTFAIASATLLDFSHTCGEEQVLATLQADGTLLLHVGPEAGRRGETGQGEVDEVFLVSPADRLMGDPAGEAVYVSAFGRKERYSGVRWIYAEGGDGHDKVTVKEGVPAPVEIWGDFDPLNHPGQTAFGNDTLAAGGGPSLLVGGGGDDDLVGGPAFCDLFGEEGQDRLFGGVGGGNLYGGDEADEFYGGRGRSTLVGGAGDDSLHAGTGDDDMYGGPDADTFFIDNGRGLLARSSLSEALFLDGGGGDTLDKIVLSGDLAPGFQEHYSALDKGTGLIWTTNGDGSVQQFIGFVNFATSFPDGVVIPGGAIFDTMKVDSLTVWSPPDVLVDVENGPPEWTGTDDVIYVGEVTPLNLNNTDPHADPDDVYRTVPTVVAVNEFVPILLAKKGSLTVNAQRGKDHLWLFSASPGMPITLDTGKDDDTITASGQLPFATTHETDDPFTRATLDRIGSRLTLIGGDGLDRVFLDDHGHEDSSVDYRISPATVRASAAVEVAIAYQEVEGLGLFAANGPSRNVIHVRPSETTTFGIVGGEKNFKAGGGDKLILDLTDITPGTVERDPSGAGRFDFDGLMPILYAFLGEVEVL